MPDFLKNAVNFTKNPLGIIALFISLAYGIAALVFSNGIKYLNTDQRTILTYFLAIFPVLVLYNFSYLVSFHHEKLYSPKDFEHDESFLQTMDQKTQRDRNLAKTMDIIEPNSDKRNVNPAESDVAPAVDPNVCSVLMAGELVIRELEVTLKTSIRRQVAFSTGGVTVNFDGTIAGKRMLTGIQVNYLKNYHLTDQTVHTLQNIIRDMEYIRKELLKQYNFKLIFAFVHDEIDESRNAALNQLFVSSFINVELKHYQLADLQQKFGY